MIITGAPKRAGGRAGAAPQQHGSGVHSSGRGIHQSQLCAAAQHYEDCGRGGGEGGVLPGAAQHWAARGRWAGLYIGCCGCHSGVLFFLGQGHHGPRLLGLCSIGPHVAGGRSSIGRFSSTLLPRWFGLLTGKEASKAKGTRVQVPAAGRSSSCPLRCFSVST